MKMRFTIHIILLLIVFSLVGCDRNQSIQPEMAYSPEQVNTMSRLDKRINGPVRFTNQDLSLLIHMISTECNCSIILGEGLDTKVTFSLENPTTRDVLESVLPSYGAMYEIDDDGTIYIKSNTSFSAISKLASVNHPAYKKLEKRIDGPVQFTNQDLRMLISMIEAEGNIDIVLDAGINKKLTFRLVDPTIRQILDTILPANGYDYVILSNGILRIGKKRTIELIKKQSGYVQPSESESSTSIPVSVNNIHTMNNSNSVLVFAWICGMLVLLLLVFLSINEMLYIHKKSNACI
jgi:hypothetical protein